ncbi:MAG TPA: hypothetical protein VHU40_09915 [Polyangia bacterium]|nr:hypothetical protein [Polyangia bacterium]
MLTEPTPTGHRPEDAAFWRALADFEPTRLEPLQRQRVGKLWAQRAQMEHGSIASFSKFSLQLLGVGAPPQLIEASHRAAIDEVHHARISFALASKFLQATLGPAGIPLAGDLLGDGSLATAALETVRDGCVGESLAAAEAEAAAREAEDEILRAAMTSIARDEGQHAELAWRFVAWAIAVGGAPLRIEVTTAFESAIARSLAAESAHDDVPAGYGHLSPARARQVREIAVREAIVPAIRALG